MNEQPSEAMEEMGNIRKRTAYWMSEHHGELIDDLDEFFYYAVKWYGAFQELNPLDAERWQVPIVSRDVALSILLSESLTIAQEISIMMRSGLLRPAMAWLRKLYETHIDAQFMELDLSGSVAYRWMHWGAAERAKLSPDDETVRKEYALLKQMFGEEADFGKPGYWWAKNAERQTVQRLAFTSATRKQVE